MPGAGLSRSDRATTGEWTASPRTGIPHISSSALPFESSRGVRPATSESLPLRTRSTAPLTPCPVGAPVPITGHTSLPITNTPVGWLPARPLRLRLNGNAARSATTKPNQGRVRSTSIQL